MPWLSKEILSFLNRGTLTQEEVFTRLLQQEPWEYICNETEFRNLRLFVNPSVLIPRIETEQIIDIAKENLDGVKNIVEIGTGSGCISISLAKEIPSSVPIFAIDIDEKALDIARRNAEGNDVENKITFIQSDLLSGQAYKSPTLYIANLPYIPTNMYNKLDRSVHDFEPGVALDGGIDGLKYYKKLIEQIPKSKNILLIEIEPSTLEDFRKLDYQFDIIKDFREKDRFLLFHLT